ncbi:mastermind-like protein 1 isoform 1-T2 [Fundulus diaphanus]
MMADFVATRHSAVMERLRRRIELFRQHHNTCETRYDGASQERLELNRQQTISLHQRLLQNKAKRASKHRQPQPSADPDAQRAPGGGAESGGTAAEQSRNTTRQVLHDVVVKRKMESGGSPLSNGLPDGLSSSKKACLDNGPANGAAMDSKLGLADRGSNGTHRAAGEAVDAGGEPDFRQKEMKQEPEDILPIMPPSVAGNNLFLDLNLNEQEWKELMEELNCSVAIEDIQEILNYGFEDRRDPLDPAPGGGGGAAGGGPQSSQSLLPDLSSVKAEFSPASAVFEQDSRTGSPQVRSTSSGPPPRPAGSPVASSSASSPVLPQSQPAPPPRQLQPPPNHLLSPGPQVPKDLSPAQQLQQLAAQQQRAQHIQGKMQHKPPQQGAKFHSQGPHSHPPPWPQMANSSQSSLGGTFGMDKPSSPALYPSDFNPNAQKQMLMPAQPNKGSPKAGAGSYMSGPPGPPNMLSHLSSGPPLSHPPAQGAQSSAAMLNYKNTIPLSHFEAGPGPPRAPSTQIQDKTALLNLLRQQQQQKSSMNFRQHIPHSQDQNSFSAAAHIPGPANPMTSGSGNNGMAAGQGNNGMAGSHSNAAFINNQMAALKHQQQQQQLLEQQKKQYLQRQLLAEQEKQRQQDQQLQRHLTRPPPQYQDQTGPAANQNPFPQQSVGQFTSSSQPISSIGSMGGHAPGTRMFPQNQGMMGMSMAQGGGPGGGGVAPPPPVSQADISLPSCGGGASVDSLYSSMSLHQQAGLQRQPLGAVSASYRQQQLLQQQLLKQQPNAAMLKQQLAATRMPSAMQGGMGGGMVGSVPGGQGAAWQQQLAGQPPSSNAGLHSNAFNNNAFHMQQPRIPKMAAGSASFGAGGRPMTGLNAAQQMMQTNMAGQQRAPPAAQSLGQQQTQQQSANQNQAVLLDLAAFGQPQGSGRQAMQCNQGYQVSRTAGQQQQVSFGYNAAAGSFAAESELVDSLLKAQSTQEWMADLDELLASHP